MREPVRGTQDVIGWNGMILRTTLGTLLNPSPVWSDRALDALVRAVDVTLWLDATGIDDPRSSPEAEDELLLWRAAEDEMKSDFERGRRAPTCS